MSVFYPKYRKTDIAVCVMKNEFVTFLSYVLNLNPIYKRMAKDPEKNETVIFLIMTFIA